MRSVAVSGSDSRDAVVIAQPLRPALGLDLRAAEAARAAVSSPLLDVSIDGATGVLFNITGDETLGLFEVNTAAEIVRNAFLHFADERYHLLAFVVMPSLHHWLFLPLES